MSLRRTLFALSLPLALWVTDRDARAQDAASLERGDRVRATYADSAAPGTALRRVEGSFVDLTDGRLRLATRSAGADREWDVPRAGLVALERAEGRLRVRGAARGAWIGALVGALPGLVFSVAMAQDDFFDVGPAEALVVTGVSAGAGAGIGALVGLAAARTDWREVPLDGGTGR